MPGAFLHKKSPLEVLKDGWGITNPIKQRRTQRSWENPITRHQREKGIQAWAKSFAGKAHYHKLTRFNAMHESKSYRDFFVEPSFYANSYVVYELEEYEGQIEEIDTFGPAMLTPGGAADILEQAKAKNPDKKYHVVAIQYDRKGDYVDSEVIWSDYVEEVAGHTNEAAGVSPYLTEIAHKVLVKDYGWTASTLDEVKSWLGDHKKAFEHGYGQALRDAKNDDYMSVKAGIEAALAEEEEAAVSAEISMQGESLRKILHESRLKKLNEDVRGSQYYVDAFEAAQEECKKLAKEQLGDEGKWDSFFNDTAKPDEAVGYYITFYTLEGAYPQWRENVKGKELSADDQQVEDTLRGLYVRQVRRVVLEAWRDALVQNFTVEMPQRDDCVDVWPMSDGEPVGVSWRVNFNTWKIGQYFTNAKGDSDLEREDDFTDLKSVRSYFAEEFEALDDTIEGGK